MSQVKIQHSQNELTIQVNTKDLNPGQVRLIKTINTLMMDVATTDNENIFFNHSAEFLRKCASLIQQAKFTMENEHLSEIPYAEQVLEYSFDILADQVMTSEITSYDN